MYSGGPQDFRGTGCLDRDLQPVPIGVVRHDETPICRAPAPYTAQRHPAAGECGRSGAEPPRSCGAKCAWRCQQQRARTNFVGDIRSHKGGVGQGDPLAAQYCVRGLNLVVSQDGANVWVHCRQQPLRLAQCVGPQN
jgi:hypothetical protein